MKRWTRRAAAIAVGACLLAGAAGAVGSSGSLLAPSSDSTFRPWMFGEDEVSGQRLRPTNVELCIFSQSCFQGEVVPCG